MTERSGLADRLDAIKGVTVLCVGDVMLDRYVEGEADRVSPEAPVPVLRVERRHAMLGGAGNVARNLVALGARAELVAVVGDDAAGREVLALAEALPGIAAGLVADSGRSTTVKTRYVASGQQLLRADDETLAPIAGGVEERVIARALAALADCDAVVLSDYGKGVLTDAVIARVVDAAGEAGKQVLVDPKGADYSRYKGADLITPNRKELAEAARLPTGSAEEVAVAAEHIIDTCGVGGVLATMGRDGMTLLTAERDGKHLSSILPAKAREVFDVSGAGDTVAATVAAGLGAGLELADAARLANVAAGIVVARRGTAVAGADEIKGALTREDLLQGDGKCVSGDRALRLVGAWRRDGLRVGFTNGVFDLIHPGHVSLLAQARAACDHLVVAINSDTSARRLKGDGRPVQSEGDRAKVLASLTTVDLVVIFDDDTPIGLIEAIRPEVLVKGADYKLEDVVGGDFVRAHGGRVLLAELAPGHSTTATIAKMAK